MHWPSCHRRLHSTASSISVHHPSSYVRSSSVSLLRLAAPPIRSRGIHHTPCIVWASSFVQASSHPSSLHPRCSDKSIMNIAGVSPNFSWPFTCLPAPPVHHKWVDDRPSFARCPYGSSRFSCWLSSRCFQTRWGYTVLRACSEPSFGILLPARISSYTAHHLTISAPPPLNLSWSNMPTTNHPSMWAHHLPHQSVQLRSLFCFSKALLRIKNCEKVVICLHAQHDNRISFMSADYARSTEYHFWRLSMLNMIGSSIMVYHTNIVHTYTSLGYHTLLSSYVVHVKVYSNDYLYHNQLWLFCLI